MLLLLRRRRQGPRDGHRGHGHGEPRLRQNPADRVALGGDQVPERPRHHKLRRDDVDFPPHRSLDPPQVALEPLFGVHLAEVVGAGEDEAGAEGGLFFFF